MAKTKAELEQEVEQAKEALEAFLTRAHDMADRAGHCSEYDRIVAFAAKDINLPEGWSIVKRGGMYEVTRRVKWVVEYDEMVVVDLTGEPRNQRTVANARQESTDYFNDWSWLNGKSDEEYLRTSIQDLESVVRVFKDRGAEGNLEAVRASGDDGGVGNFDIEYYVEGPDEYKVE